MSELQEKTRTTLMDTGQELGQNGVEVIDMSERGTGSILFAAVMSHWVLDWGRLELNSRMKRELSDDGH